jgi:hypothetical protein
MNAFQIRTLLCSGLMAGWLDAQQVIFTDDFDDNTNTGWTYFNRDGAEEIADAVWVETGGRLEQQTPNFDFPRDAQNDPYLGAIALAPQQVGGHYSLSAEFTSLEPGNSNQDQDYVFGYVDENNFFMMEAIGGSVNVFNVVDGDRVLIASGPNTFSHAPYAVVLEHNADTGEVIVTFGTNPPVNLSDPVFIRTGTNSVGVGTNNDAFAIDDFSITQLGTPAPEQSLEITAFSYSAGDSTANITWTSQAGVLYTVSRSFDLVLWDDLEDSAVGLEGSTSFTDTNATGTKIFYRVSITPIDP